VNVDTGAFQALTAEVARLAEAVRGMAVREVAIEMVFEAGRAAGQDDIRDAMPGRAAETSRKPRPRPGHLQAINGGAS
jgi:hypothetical protein